MAEKENNRNWFAVAVRIEEMGIELYARLLALLEDGSRAQEDVSYLLEQENYHRAWFEGRMREFEERGAAGTPDTRTAGAMPGPRAAADSTAGLVPAELERELEAILSGRLPETAREALLLGARVERETIRFYDDILSSLSGKEERKALGKIIDEEREHYQRINLLLET